MDQLYRNRGDGTFAPRVTHAVGDWPVSVTSADVDNDGWADLVTGNIWSKRDMTCVVIGDGDDDNEMWHLINYEYHQGPCQWKCDFIGDEFFSMGRYDGAQGRWVSRFENPAFEHISAMKSRTSLRLFSSAGISR